MILSAFTAFGLSGNHKVSSKPWYFDSGASNHMTNTVVPLSNIKNYDGNLKINTADGSSLLISTVGDLSSSLTDVFVSPDLSTNLISVGQLVDNNCNVHFSHSSCVVQDQVSRQMIAKGPKVGRLFPLRVSPSTFIPSFPLLSFTCNVVGSSNKMWHGHLGHPNSDVLRTLFNSGLLGNKACSSIDLSFDCTSCKLGKSKVLPFPHHASYASQCFELIHSDVWGIALVVSHAHYKYFVTFIDDFSRFTWVYFLRAKGEVFSVFKCFLALLETQFPASIKVLRFDSGGEYMSNEFQVFLQSKGIISQRSCPLTPQQNGVAERKNRHLLDVVRTLLLESSVPPRFWCEALSTAVHLINCYPLLRQIMFLLTLSCLVILLYIMIFEHLVVFVLCISLLMNEINLLLSLLSVFFLVMLSLTRVMFVMIPMLLVYGFPGMRSLKINISFHLMFNCHLHLYLLFLFFLNLLQLWNSSILVLCMRDVVDMSLVPLPLCLLPILTWRLILLLLPPLFVGLLVLLDPLIGMVSSLMSLLLLLYPLFSFLLATNRPWNMNVGKLQCKQNFKHLRKITLGILFLVLLQSNLLRVNEFFL